MITVLPVFREEGWHSMDLCADMLVKHAHSDIALEVGLPKYKKVLGFLPSNKAKNFDRWYNRWRMYPKYAEKLAKQPGFFHIVDHSYAHLASHLPEGRVGIYCHDLDAFKCILEPDKEQRPEWFRKMMGRVFDGFKRAKFVFCNSNYTVQQVKNLGIWDSADIILAPLGVATEFSHIGEHEHGNFILHVGSCIPRKRIDVLLKVFSKIAFEDPNLFLVQAGGTFTNAQLNMIQSLGIGKKVFQKRGLSRSQLARLYRGARCLLITSEAEGFGIPLIEAMSCRCPTLCTDIPVLREVAGEFARYCSISDLEKWVKEFNGLENKKDDDLLMARITQHLKIYSWDNHALCILNTYRKRFGL